MATSTEKSKVTRLETFKAVSTFISSVVIAMAGIYVTSQYNAKQLAISDQQKTAELAIAQNRELANLIPQLGSQDTNVRKFSAISLGMYGKHAIPALIASLADEDMAVRMAAIRSLGIIGHDAVPELFKIAIERRNNYNTRAGAVYALGMIGGPSIYNLEVSIIQDRSEDPDVRKDAASALGFLRDQRAVNPLISLLNQSNKTDALLIAAAVWSLGEIQATAAVDPISHLLSHPDKEVRFQVVWALGKIGGERARLTLVQAQTRDQDQRVRDAATAAQEWMKRKDGGPELSNEKGGAEAVNAHPAAHETVIDVRE